MVAFSVRHIDYLEGRGLAGGEMRGRAPLTEAPPERRRLLRITRVGRESHSQAPNAGGDVPPSADLMVGMYAYKIPLAIEIGCDPRGIDLRFGVWSPDPQAGAAGGAIEAWRDVLEALVAGAYPGTETEPAESGGAREAEAGTLVLGIPSFRSAEPSGEALPLDRLIRAMAAGAGPAGSDWSALVLAEPIDESVIEAVRGELLAEFLETRAGRNEARIETPMADYYLRLLDVATGRAVQALAEGAWRVAVYLTGDPPALARLASTWKSVFQGPHSVPQPLALHPIPAVPDFTRRWAMPDAAGIPGPGLYNHPFAWQSLLTSRELAAYGHLPKIETRGLAVRPVTRFGVVAQARPFDASLRIGEICDLRRRAGTDYRAALDDLRRHGLIVGMTGSGKTNTVKGALAEFDMRGVPFLVIEPAKKEYRELLSARQFADRLSVWTVGDETSAPLRLNPFEFEPGTPVATHIDLLKSLFTASFGLWTPLPQILERCLHEIYEDRGFVVATGENLRAGDSTGDLDFPTLSDLVAKVATVTEGLGYHGEFTANARAALQTRLDSLRAGAKGRMLDVAVGVPVSLLLERPTVVELEDVGDDDDKAFFIGLVLVRLVEHRRIAGPREGLRHVIVFEEAHRLFSHAGPRTSEEQASPRAKAVETFSNMLAEVRAYGQGVLVAEQSPTKLAQDVIKNTALKICHRLVDREERAAMAGAMAMTAEQATALSTLRRNQGEAIVFGEGDETPLMVSVPRFAPEPAPPSDVTEVIAARWRALRADAGLERYYLPLPTCGAHCRPLNPNCAEDRRVAVGEGVRAAVESLVLSLAVAGDATAALATTRLLTEAIARQIAAGRGHGAEPYIRLRCVTSHAAQAYLARWGRDYGVDLAETRDMAETLIAALNGYFAGPSESDGRDLAAFGERYARACAGPGPFRQCLATCGDRCLYRFANRDRPVRRRLAEALDAAIARLPTDPLAAAEELEAVWAGASDGLLAAGADPLAAWRAGACFILHRIDALDGYRWDEKTKLADTCLKLVPAPRKEEIEA